MSSSPQLGLHVSIAESIDLAFDRAAKVGATSFQIFTRNPNRWAFSPLDDSAVSLFRKKKKSMGYKKIVAHMPYLPNLASPLKETMKLSRDSLTAEVSRCDKLDIDYLVVHLGSHLGKGSAAGVRNVAGACSNALGKSAGKTTILLENMAGQKNCVGARFEELREILDLVGEDSRMGICFDSCHAYAAGFDLANQEAVQQSMDLFDQVVGINRICVTHLNDSKGALGSKLDRHEFIGKGKIGKAGMRSLMNHSGIRSKLMIMETPYEDESGMMESMTAARKLLSSSS